ncbi:hypothetical protein PENTCL1PPCAC_24180, partial [Pristionchus entomophagus]
NLFISLLTLHNRLIIHQSITVDYIYSGNLLMLLSWRLRLLRWQIIVQWLVFDLFTKIFVTYVHVSPSSPITSVSNITSSTAKGSSLITLSSVKFPYKIGSIFGSSNEGIKYSVENISEGSISSSLGRVLTYQR